MKVRQAGIGSMQVFKEEEVIDEGRFCLHLFTRRRFSFGFACSSQLSERSGREPMFTAPAVNILYSD